MIDFKGLAGNVKTCDPKSANGGTWQAGILFQREFRYPGRKARLRSRVRWGADSGGMPSPPCSWLSHFGETDARLANMMASGCPAGARSLTGPNITFQLLKGINEINRAPVGRRWKAFHAL